MLPARIIAIDMVKKKKKKKGIIALEYQNFDNHLGWTNFK